MPKLVYADGTGARGTVEMGSEPVLIGRATECQIQTQDGLVSRRHARLFFDGGSYWIEDLGSANGVFIGNDRVHRQQLRPGEIFRCGGLEVRFEADPWNPISAGGSPSGQLHQMLTQPPVPVPVIAAAPPPLPPPIPAVSVPPPLPPAVSAPPPPPVAAVAASSPAAAAQAAELQALRAELETERRRRTDIEFDRDEAKRKLEELQARPAGISPDEAERLKRRVEQLESEVRRKGGGGGGGGGADPRSFDAERERLRARITELEAQVAASAAAAAAVPAPAAAAPKNEDQEMEVIRLRRKIEQLESDLRRARGGKAAPEPAASAPSSASGSEAMAKLTEELDRAKRRIDQLESEAKRRPIGTIADGQRMEAQRSELEGALRQLRDVERERDSLREVVAIGQGQSQGQAPAGRPSPKVAEHLTAVSDGLADVRAALRAAGDDLALEQLEQIRAQLRQAATALGLSL